MGPILLIILGILSLAAGFLAMLNPFGASVAATVIAGWAFVLLGILEIIAAFQATGRGARIWAIILGVIAVVIGVNVLGEPLKSMVALTLVVGVMFVASGIFKLIVGFGASGNLRWAVLISAVASLVLGGIVLAYFPESAFITLGIMLAVELISNGIVMIAMGAGLRSLKKQMA